MGRGAWWTAVHRVSLSRTQLKRLSMHACIGEGEWQPTPVFLPGESQGQGILGLPSMGSHRFEHDWSDLAEAAAACLGDLCLIPG